MNSDSFSARSQVVPRLMGATILVAVLATLNVAFAQDTESLYVLDHFRCYELLIGTAPVEVQVTLQDQFDVKRQIEEEVWVGYPGRFCNPVTKRKDVWPTGNVEVTPIRDPDAHLTMYRITDRTVHRPVSWNVVVSNQFGTQKILAKRPRLLAVPTEKVEDGLEFPERLDHFKCYEAYGKEVAIEVRLQDQFEQAEVVVLDPKLFCNPTRKTDSAGTEFGIQSPKLHLTCYDLIPTAPTEFPQAVHRSIRNQLTGGREASVEAFDDEDLLCVPSRKVSFSAVSGSLGPSDLTRN